MNVLTYVRLQAKKYPTASAILIEGLCLMSIILLITGIAKFAISRKEHTAYRSQYCGYLCTKQVPYTYQKDPDFATLVAGAVFGAISLLLLVLFFHQDLNWLPWRQHRTSTSMPSSGLKSMGQVDVLHQNINLNTLYEPNTLKEPPIYQQPIYPQDIGLPRHARS